MSNCYNISYIRLNIDDLIYFEADSNYVKLVTSKEVYRFRTTLRMLEEELMNKGFIRIHKGFLVNQIFVHTIRAADVELTNGVLLPISRTNKEEVRKQLLRYMR